MPTVIDDNTGEEVEVHPVAAVVAVAMVNNFNGEYPADASKRIEQAMAAAARNAMTDGVSEPEELRKRMLEARESAKLAMKNEQRDARSQAEAAARGM